MRRLSTWVVIVLTLLCPLALSAAAEVDWNPMTEELPPYSLLEKEEVRGICADVLLQLLAKNSIKVERGDIKMLPWARAYKTAQDVPGSILLNTARTPEREEMFKWVGPVRELTIGLLALKKDKIEFETLTETGKFKIGVIRDGVAEQLLLKAGVKEEQLDRIADPTLNLRKLGAGRIDLFAFSVPTARYILVKMGLNPDDYESVYTLKQAELFFAFHRDSDEELVQALNKTLQEMLEKDGSGRSEIDRISDNYLKP
ncbi:MAG: ABC transporter substrate-binding protein [Thermodesulfobacteriota bacterium]